MKKSATFLKNYLMIWVIASGIAFPVFANNTRADNCSDEIIQYNECLKEYPIEKCSTDVVRSYTGTLNIPLNLTLRGFKKDNECLEVTEILKRSLPSLGTIKDTVYSGSKYIKELEHSVVGDCYQVPSFLSTSLNDQIGQGFRGTEKSTLLIIHTTTGVDVRSESQITEESEVLIIPGKWLKILKHGPDSKGNVIEFQEVDEEQCLAAKLDAANPLVTIQIKEASLGLNLSPKNKNNATTEAASFCDGKTICNYQISNKFLKDPAPDQDKTFILTWNCMDGKIAKGPYVVDVPTPATGVKFGFGCTKNGSKMVRYPQ